MTDRELLERAARAYWGDEIDDVCSIRWLETDHAIGYTHGDNQDHNGEDREFVWNPLDDDGDALRLAVKLRLSVCHHHNGDNPAVTAMVPVEWHGKFMEADEPHGDDINESTRRAIVRAAAAMAPEEAR